MSGWRAVSTVIFAAVVTVSWSLAIRDEPTFVSGEWHRGSFALALLAYFVMFPGRVQRALQWSAVLSGVGLWIVLSQRPVLVGWGEVSDSLRATVVALLGLALVVVTVPTISRHPARVVVAVVGLCFVSLLALREYFWATFLLFVFTAVVVAYHSIEAARAIVTQSDGFEPSPRDASGSEPHVPGPRADEPFPKRPPVFEPLPRVAESLAGFINIWLRPVGQWRAALPLVNALLTWIALAILLVFATNVNRHVLVYAAVGSALAIVWLLVALGILYRVRRALGLTHGFELRCSMTEAVLQHFESFGRSGIYAAAWVLSTWGCAWPLGSHSTPPLRSSSGLRHGLPFSFPAGRSWSAVTTSL